MIPLQLTLRNFLSYRDEATIDFTNIRIACLSGDNGAGKSALLDAITWALWGETRTPSDRDVISIGAIEMEVTFVFRLGDREYRVFRRRSTHGAGRLTIELEARAPGDDTWSQITGDSARHTRRRSAGCSIWIMRHLSTLRSSCRAKPTRLPKSPRATVRRSPAISSTCASMTTPGALEAGGARPARTPVCDPGPDGRAR